MARPRDRELERLWEQRLLRDSASGLSVAGFRAREVVGSSAFSSWRRRLASESPSPSCPFREPRVSSYGDTR